MFMKQHWVVLVVIPLILSESVALLEPIESYLKTLPNALFLESKSLHTLLRSASNYKSGILSCDHDIHRLTKGLLQKEEWALKVIDSSSYFIPGLLNGNLGGLGNFDECLEIRLPGNDHWTLYSLVELEVERNRPLNFTRQALADSLSDFISELLSALKNETCPKNKFPVIDWFSDGSVLRSQLAVDARNGSFNSQWQPFAKLHLGVCFPRSCGTEFPRIFLEHLLSPLDDILRKSSYRLSYLPPRYYDKDVGLPRKLERADWFVMLCYALLAIVIALGTFLDLSKQKDPDLKMIGWRDHILTFSLYTNTRKLFTVESSNANSYLSTLDGLRVISIMTIVFLHRIFVELFFFIPSTNNIAQTQMLKNPSIISATSFANVAVDTFFTVGGILNANLFLKSMDKQRKFDIIKYIVHRYLRLTPALALLVSFNATLFYHMGNGPFWSKIVGEERRKCQQFWWTNILYIANYFHNESTDLSECFPCVGQTWYVMVDMQMYFLSILVLLPLWYWRKAGTVWLYFLMALSSAVPFTVASMYGFRVPMPLYNWGEGKFLVHYLYQPTYSRASPYLVGLLFGYYLHQAQKGSSDFKLSSKTLVVGWALSVGFALVVIFVPIKLYNFEDHDDAWIWIPSLYLGFHRLMWGFAIGWIVFVCETGYAGKAKTFLSCYLFRFLNKFLYGIFLTHVSIQKINISSSRTPIFFSISGVFRNFLSDFFLAVIFGGLLTLGVEYPLRQLETRIFKGTSKKEKTTGYIKQSQEDVAIENQALTNYSQSSFN